MIISSYFKKCYQICAKPSQTKRTGVLFVGSFCLPVFPVLGEIKKRKKKGDFVSGTQPDILATLGCPKMRNKLLFIVQLLCTLPYYITYRPLRPL